MTIDPYGLLVILAVGFVAGCWAATRWNRVRRVERTVVKRGRGRRPDTNAEKVTVGKNLTWIRTAVYVIRDRDHRVLYVGIAANPTKRMRQHAEAKDWWPDVEHVEAHWFFDRHVACGVEWALIRYLRPLHNLAPGGIDDAYSEDRPDIEPAEVTIPSRFVARTRRAAGW